MPLLREAVEKKRNLFIKSLIQQGILNEADIDTRKFTLTELTYIYQKNQHLFKDSRPV